MITITIAVLSRFHNPSEEIVIGRDVVPPINDDIQLTVEEYRSNLYEVGNINCVNWRFFRLSESELPLLLVCNLSCWKASKYYANVTKLCQISVISCCNLRWLTCWVVNREIRS